MAFTDSDLSELLAAVQAGELTEKIRTSLTWVLQQLIEAELTTTIGARPHERTETRTAMRNGHRPKLVSTPAGDLELEIPKLREGSFLPLPPRATPAHRPGPLRRRHGGLRPWRLDPQGRRPRESARSRLGHLPRGGLPHLRRPRQRPRGLPHPPPRRRVPLRLRRCHLREGSGAGTCRLACRRHRHGCGLRGNREVLGIDVGDSEDGAFWTAFFRSLRARGLSGVQLVVSDHHLGLKQAIASVFLGASWQRCRVHFMRNVLSKVPKASAEMVAAAIRTVFLSPTLATFAASSPR